MYNHFVDENEAYYKKNKFYNDENKLFERLEYLNKVIRSFTLAKNFS